MDHQLERRQTIIRDATRFFTRTIKEQCWNKALPLPGRDPSRWRFDAVGNIVCKKLAGCEGCLCYEHDHIIPHSKGGLSELSNCQILQTRVNRYKGNKEPASGNLIFTNSSLQLTKYSCVKKFLDFELDLIEIALWGNVKSTNKECRCKSWMELDTSWQELHNSSKLRHLQAIPNCE